MKRLLRLISDIYYQVSGKVMGKKKKKIKHLRSNIPYKPLPIEEFLNIKGYNKESDILVINPNDIVAEGIIKKDNGKLGRLIYLNVKNPAIIRAGYSGNRGKLW